MSHEKRKSAMKDKSARTSVDIAAVDVWRREVGELSNRKFTNRLAASKDLVLRLDILKQLEKKGFVYTVSFNADGNILVSGSDSGWIILQDWDTGLDKLMFDSGHDRIDRIFQAKIMPYLDDRSLITCADDGQVRHARLSDCGAETRLLAKHQGRAYKLAVEPGNPCTFYTCGDDGAVKHIDLRTAPANKDLFKCHSIDESGADKVVPLYAIAIDPWHPNLFAVAGSDKYTRLYDIRKYKQDGSTEFGQPTDYFYPPHLIGNHQVGVTCLAYSDQSELLVSYTDESIYLFTPGVGLGYNPFPSSPFSACSEAMPGVEKDIPQVYEGHGNKEMAKCVSFYGPKSEYVVSGSSFGRMFIWKKKGGELVRVMKADVHMVKCIEPHPRDTMVLASCGYEDIKIWTSKAIDKPLLPTYVEEGSDYSPGRSFSVGACYYFSFTDDDEDICAAGGCLETSSDEE